MFSVWKENKGERTMVKGDIIKFREQEGEGIIIDEVRDLLGVADRSEAIRCLIHFGSLYIKDLYSKVMICATPIKISQIDNFFTSIKIRAIKEKKEKKEIEQRID